MASSKSLDHLHEYVEKNPELLLAQAQRLPDREIPFEALEGAPSDAEMRSGASERHLDPFFAPVVPVAPTPKHVTDIPLKAGYRNIYGTELDATFNPTTGFVKGSAQIPIGAAEKGHRIGIEGYYSGKDPLMPGSKPGFGGMIRYTKRNEIDPRTYSAPGQEKYAFEAGFGNQQRTTFEPAMNTVPRRGPYPYPGHGGMHPGMMQGMPPGMSGGAMLPPSR